MQKNKKLKFITILSILIGCASGISVISVNAKTAPNDKTAPEEAYDDVKEYDVSYYSSVVGKKGDGLLNQLATISQQNRYFNTYDELWGGNCYSDADKNDPDNKLIDFYTQLSISNEYRTSNMSGYNADVNWNREHVWCKSLSDNLYGTSNAGADIHHLRPNVASINSSRNNSPYGEVGDAYAKYYNQTEGVHASSSTGTLYGYLNNNVFEPIDKVKGDVARIVMYMYMHYSKEVTNNSSYSKAGNLSISSIVSASNEFELLRKWNDEDKPDSFEKNRNNYCASVTGLRNPFIDHPEFADIIWDESYSGNGALKDDVGGNQTPSYYLELTTTNATIEVGNTYQIQVNTNIPSLTYTTSNQTVASVNQSGLITAKSAGNATITVSGSSLSKQFSVTVNQPSSGNENTTQGGWQLVDNINMLEINDKVIIAAKESDVAMSTTQNGNNRGQASITKVQTSLEEPSSSVQQFTLENGTQNNTYSFKTSSGYIYAAGNIASGNYLRTQTTKDDSASWTISINTDGTATIKTVASVASNLLKYNSGASLFSCYNSGQKDVCLYKYVETSSQPQEPELSLSIPTRVELGFKSTYTTTTNTTQTSSQYEKVTTEPSDWSGTYLIVYEKTSLAFNSSLTKLDVSKNGTSVSINNGVITSNQTTDSISFTIAKSGNGYSIKSASGYYIGATGNSNSLLSDLTTQYTNKISLNSSDKSVNIIGSGGAYLRYNANTSDGSLRFRYYKSSSYTSQQAIHLYKKVGSTTQQTETKWTFSDYQLRFSSTFTKDVVLDGTYSMNSLTFGYVITSKKFLDNNNYSSFEEAYKDNNNDLDTMKTLLKAKSDTLNLTNENNKYSFGFILKGISNPNTQFSVAFKIIYWV